MRETWIQPWYFVTHCMERPWNCIFLPSCFRSSGAEVLAERVLDKLASMETKCEDVLDPLEGIGVSSNSSTSDTSLDTLPDSGFRDRDVLRSAAQYNATDRDMILKLFLPRKYWSNSTSSSSNEDIHNSAISSSSSSSSTSSSLNPSHSFVHVPETHPVDPGDEDEDDNDTSDIFTTYGD